ncbi:hypothetical protein QFZ63_005063 [Streptomyces sp. B3I7]|uniref:chaplin n=1 Tax=Streptomyces sp. B3I7 TaxID=3042269 RepID=UPI002788FE02|nr:chaplin [Streptomyces sp. B3I7]MDQ0813349.1 hypothetical protein [Streptomyces sp. B3I7]
MRQTLNRGMIAAAAATGIFSLCAAPALADSNADGTAANSPGVAAGNVVQAPVDVPVNVCGNSVDVVGALNPTDGNRCENDGYGEASEPSKKHAPEEEPPEHHTLPAPHTPSVATHTEQSYAQPPALAETGGRGLVAASLVSAGLLTGGMVLYRRGRATAQR